jgi:hypothetical protein
MVRPIIPGPRIFNGKQYEYHDTYWTKKMATQIKANMIKKGYLCRVSYSKYGGYRVYVRKIA